MRSFKSNFYKLVERNIVVAEGSKREMLRLKKQRPGTFVGMGEPRPSIGQVWDKSVTHEQR